MPDEKDIKKAKKLLLFKENKDLAIFYELIELNETMKLLLQKDIKIPEQKDFPEIPVTDLSGVVGKLDALLKAIEKAKEPEEINVTLQIDD